MTAELLAQFEMQRSVDEQRRQLMQADAALKARG